MALKWTVDERYGSQASPTETYRIMHPPGQKYTALYVATSLGGAVITDNIGEFDTLEQAVKKCEDHSTGEKPAPAVEPTLTSEQLTSKYS